MLENQSIDSKQQIVKKVRDSNFELLRCITMLWITFYHLNCHGFRILSSESSFDFNNLIIKGVSSFQGVSNLIFLMISGYFLVNVKFCWKKVFKLWFQCLFFSILLGIPLYLLKVPCIPGDGIALRIIESKDFIKIFFPILSNNTWFTTYYLIFYMLSPFIAVIIQNIGKIEHFVLICISVFFGSFLPLFFSPYSFSPLYYFIMVFFISSFIRKYNPEILNNNKIMCLVLLLSVISYILIYFCLVVFFEGKGIDKIKGMTRLPMLIIAIAVFCIFKNMKLKYIPFINKISSCTLSVYLLHDNRFSCFIWETVFKIPSMRYSKLYILYSITCVFVIFTIAVCIELLRKRLIEKPIMNLYDYIFVK